MKKFANVPPDGCFEVLEEDNSLVISLSPSLYPKNVVMRAAYRLLENYVVWVVGDGIKKIVVKISPQEEGQKIDKDVLDIFFVELLQAYMEEAQAERYAEIRNALVSTAINALNFSKLTGKPIDEILEMLVDVDERENKKKDRKS